MSENDIMQLNNLTDRELLVRLATQFEGIEGDIDDIKKQLKDQDCADRNLLIDFTVVKTKVVMWGALGGIGASIIMAGIILLVESIIR